MIDDLIYDLTIRFPRDKIVYKTDRYMILAGDKYIREVPQEVIDELVDNSLVYINEHKGCIPTTAMFVYSDKLKVATKEIESKNHPGQKSTVGVEKERWQ